MAALSPTSGGINEISPASFGFASIGCAVLRARAGHWKPAPEDNTEYSVQGIEARYVAAAHKDRPAASAERPIGRREYFDASDDIAIPRHLRYRKARTASVAGVNLSGGWVPAMGGHRSEYLRPQAKLRRRANMTAPLDKVFVTRRDDDLTI